MSYKNYRLSVRDMLLMNKYGNFAAELPYFCFNTNENDDNGSVLLTNGSLLVTYEYRGRDLHSSTNAEMNATIRQLSNALNQVEEGWSIHVDVVREKSDTYIDPRLNHFGKNITAEILDEEGREAFKGSENNIENKYYLSLCYLPPNDLVNNVNKALYTSSNELDSVDKLLAKDGDYAKHVEHFYDVAKRVVSYLCEGVSLTYFHLLNRREMLNFLYKCISGENQYFKLTKQAPCFLQYLLSNNDVIVENYPKIGKKYVGSVAVYDLPHSVYPGIMDELNGLNMEFRFNTRYVILDNEKAVKEIKSVAEKWKTKRKGFIGRIMEAMNISSKDDDFAITQEMEAEEQLMYVQSGENKYGYYNCSILVFNENLEELKKQLLVLETKLRFKEFSVKVEDINAFDSYMGSLPGKTFENLIKLPIFTMQLATLFPITAYWGGDFESNKNFKQNGGDNPVLGYVVTDNNSPFRFTHHSSTLTDVGHTMIIGPAGSGKSTLLNFIASQYPRYKDSYIFHFDKGASSRVLNYAFDGLFYDIIEEGETEDLAISFQPLFKLDIAADFLWCENWLCNILELNNLTITHTLRVRVKEALKELKLISPEKRTLSNFHTLVQDNSIKEVIVNYTKSDSVGKIFDGNEYKIDMARYTVFEMKGLLTLADKKYIVPVIEFLFKIIEDKISTNSSPSILILDEAWVFLDNQAFRDKIKGWLKELRKYNCSVIFATQSLQEAFASEIANTLFQECPTKILLPNNQANNPTVRQYYEQIGLNDNEIDLIQNATPKKDYYIMKDNDRRVFDLGLEKRPALLSLIANSGVEINKLAKKVKEEYGDEFTYYWWEIYQEKKNISLIKWLNLFSEKYSNLKNEEFDN